MGFSLRLLNKLIIGLLFLSIPVSAYIPQEPIINPYSSEYKRIAPYRAVLFKYGHTAPYNDEYVKRVIISKIQIADNGAIIKLPGKRFVPSVSDLVKDRPGGIVDFKYNFPEEQSLNLDMRTGWTREQEFWIDMFFWSVQALDVYSTYRGVQYDCVYEVNPLLDEVPKVHEMIGLKMTIIGGLDAAFQYDEEFFTGWKLFSGITTAVIVANNFKILDRAKRRCDKR